jgi:hypothetical protein
MLENTLLQQKQNQKLGEVVENLGVKKELEMLELVQVDLHYGLVEVLFLDQNHVL